MGLIFKPSSPTAVSMRPFATSLANSLPGQRGVKTRVMMGFIMRAVGDGKNVTITVIEVGGFIGGAFGNLERRYSEFSPAPGKLVAFYRSAMPPIGAAISSSDASGATPGFVSYCASGGVRIGGSASWTSTHNILPSAIPRASVMPSAILFPAVTGTVSSERTSNQADTPSNRSVLVQRLNAATAWAASNVAPQPAPADPYGLRLNPSAHERTPDAIGYVELAAPALSLGSDELLAGSNAALEWGALEGAVTFQAQTAPVVPNTAEVIQSVGSSGVPQDGAYPDGQTFPGPVGARYAHRKVGADAEVSLRCARYSIAASDDENEDGEPIKIYAPGVPWAIKLDGSGAAAPLVPDTPPAMTAAPAAHQDGYVPTATAWRNLWRLQDVMLWSSRAGRKGGHTAEGETIMGIGTAIVRRFRNTTRRVVTSIGTFTAAVPYAPRSITWGAGPAIMTYHDRHTVRFFINPVTGAVTYESLYQFVNCYSVKANDCQYHTGVFQAGMNLEHLGSDQLQNYDTDVLEGFTHSPLLGFTVVTPATEDDPELREPFIACRRKRALCEVLPAAQDWAAHPAVPGANGGSAHGPIWYGIAPPYILVADEGEVLLTGRPFDPFPGYPASFPYRVEKRNPTKAELAENDKVVVIGATGAEVVMQLGDYYPDFGDGPLVAARKERQQSTKSEYKPDLVDRGVPVCHYAPGVICVVVIPKSQFPEPRPYWPWPAPYTSPMPAAPYSELYSYSAEGASEEAYLAWVAANAAGRQIPAEPETPAPLPQDRYLALCDIRTGELLAVSPAPIYTGTARQDTPKSQHRRASIALSCVEMGVRDPETGEITQHAVLIYSVREPIRSDQYDWSYVAGTSIRLTSDLGAISKPLMFNPYAIAPHYLGSPIAPAQINVSTGIPGVRGKSAKPPA